MIVGGKKLSKKEVSEFLNKVAEYVKDNGFDDPFIGEKTSYDVLKLASNNPEQFIRHFPDIKSIDYQSGESLVEFLREAANKQIESLSKADIDYIDKADINKKPPKSHFEMISIQIANLLLQYYEKNHTVYPDQYLRVMKNSNGFGGSIFVNQIKLSKKDPERIMEAMRLKDSDYMYKLDNVKLFLKRLSKLCKHKTINNNEEVNQLVEKFFDGARLDKAFKVQETEHLPCSASLKLLDYNVSVGFNFDFSVKQIKDNIHIFEETVNKLNDVYDRGDWSDSAHKPYYNKIIKSNFFSGYAAKHLYKTHKDLYDDFFKLFSKTTDTRRKTSNRMIVTFCKRAIEYHDLSDDSMPASIVVFCSL